MNNSVHVSGAEHGLLLFMRSRTSESE